MRILQLVHMGNEYAFNNVDFYRRRKDVVDDFQPGAGEAFPDPRLYGAVIVYGGYMSAYDDAHHPWLLEELAFLESCLKAGVPVLGICLGSQLLARLLGARVYRSEYPEFGFTKLGLTDEGLRHPAMAALVSGRPEPRFLGLEWHSDAWDLPSGASRLAESPRWPNQAFSYGGRTLAIQFHLEFTHEHMAHCMREDPEEVPSFPGAELPESFLADRGRFAEIKGNFERLLEGFLGKA